MRNFLPIGKKVKHKVSSVLHAATQDSLPCHPDTEFHCGLFLFFFLFHWGIFYCFGRRCCAVLFYSKDMNVALVLH